MLTRCQGILGHFMKFTALWWYYLIHKFKSGIKPSPAVPGTFCWRELNLINMNKTQLPDKLSQISTLSQLSVLQNHCRNTAVLQQLWLNMNSNNLTYTVPQEIHWRSDPKQVRMTRRMTRRHQSSWRHSDVVSSIYQSSHACFRALSIIPSSRTELITQELCFTVIIIIHPELSPLPSPINAPISSQWCNQIELIHH